MSKLLPIIHLPNRADREKLVRALYGLGRRIACHGDVESGVTFVDDGEYIWISGVRPWVIIASKPPQPASFKVTYVNSIRHFLAYTAQHHPANG